MSYSPEDRERVAAIREMLQHIQRLSCPTVRIERERQRHHLDDVWEVARLALVRLEALSSPMERGGGDKE